MTEPNSKHPNYDNQLIPPNNDIFKPEFKRDSRGRYFMQLPGYGKWMVGNEPGSKIIAQGSEDERGGPGTDPGSLRAGSLTVETTIWVGDDIYLDGGTGCIIIGDPKKIYLSMCKDGMIGVADKIPVFAFLLEKQTWEWRAGEKADRGDVLIGDINNNEFVYWNDDESILYVEGNITATTGTIGGWDIGTCLKKEYTISTPSKTKIELCAGNPGHIQAAYSPTGSFSLPGDVYMVQITQGSTGDSGGVPIPRMDIYRNGAKRMMLNSDGLYFFESDGSTVASSILSGATNEENFSNVDITGGDISGQSVSNVGHVANNTPDIIPTSFVVSDTGTIVADDGTISSYITLTWNAISTNTFNHYLIRYKQHSYIHYNYIEAKTNTVTIDGFVPNISIDFAIASVNKFGITSSYSSTVNSTTAADAIAPATPTGLTAIGGFKKVVLIWNANTEYDLSEYNIYRYTSNSSASASKIGVSDSSQFIDDLSSVAYTDGESTSTYYYWIKAVDTSRNASGFSSGASDKSKLIDEDSVYYIGAAKILIDGTTYFSSWRHPDSLTKIDGGVIYAGSSIEIASSGHIKSGQTDYNTGIGWWLGDVSGTPKLSIGNSSGAGLTWDSSALNVTGVIKATSGYIGGTASGWKIGSNVLQAYSGATKIIELSSSGPHIQCLKDANNYVQMTPASSDPRFDVFVSGARRIRLNASGLTFFTAGGAETNKIGLGTGDGDVTFGSGVVRCFTGGVRISHTHGFHAADNGSTYYFQLYVDGTNDATYGYQNILSLSTSNYLKIENSAHGAIARFNGISGGSWALDLFGNLALYTTTSDTGSTIGTMYFNTSSNQLRVRYNGGWAEVGAGGGETNTASNKGGTYGWYSNKSGVDLQFKGITVGSRLSLTSYTNYLYLDHTTGSGYNHIPSGGTTYQMLRNSASGTGSWSSQLYMGGSSLYYWALISSRITSSADVYVNGSMHTSGNVYTGGASASSGSVNIALIHLSHAATNPSSHGEIRNYASGAIDQFRGVPGDGSWLGSFDMTAA